eukprot:GSMAST32.ASY1.ANO1.920.1 assembled CDS
MSNSKGLTDVVASSENVWLLLCGMHVFLMQVGFLVLEVGAVQKKAAINIIFKNYADTCLGALTWFAVGFAIANADNGAFLMRNLKSGSELTNWFFSFTFAATSATIVSGAVAERTKISAYFFYTLVITGFVYPLVVRQVWSTNADRWPRSFDHYGFIDFAGSGVVHAVGGLCGLVGATLVGPRVGRFSTKYSNQRNMSRLLGPLLPEDNCWTMGREISYFCYQGFNASSGPGVTSNGTYTTALAIVNTTLAPASACFTALIFTKFFWNVYDIQMSLNAILAGAVSITASCGIVSPAASICIGVIGSLILLLFSWILEKFEIDDPLDASSVHGFCGIWGCLAVGIFATDEKVAAGLSIVCITIWTLTCAFIVFFGLDKVYVLSDCVQLSGVDVREHGFTLYNHGSRISCPSSSSMNKPHNHKNKEFDNTNNDKSWAEKTAVAAYKSISGKPEIHITIRTEEEKNKKMSDIEMIESKKTDLQKENLVDLPNWSQERDNLDSKLSLRKRHVCLNFFSNSNLFFVRNFVPNKF